MFVLANIRFYQVARKFILIVHVIFVHVCGVRKFDFACYDKSQLAPLCTHIFKLANIMNGYCQS